MKAIAHREPIDQSQPRFSSSFAHINAAKSFAVSITIVTGQEETDSPT
jgi:hypothetical protein